MFNSTRFWAHGPLTVDWIIDLGDGTFGPLHLGSPVDEIKSALGRPDNPRFFGIGHCLYYQRFALTLYLDKSMCVGDFEITMPEREENEDNSSMALSSSTSSAFGTPLAFPAPSFNPSVKLPGTSSRLLRRWALEDFANAFASYRDVQSDCYREWALADIVIYVDLQEDNRTITTLGWMKNDE